MRRRDTHETTQYCTAVPILTTTVTSLVASPHIVTFLKAPETSKYPLDAALHKSTTAKGAEVRPARARPIIHHTKPPHTRGRARHVPHLALTLSLPYCVCHE